MKKIIAGVAIISVALFGASQVQAGSDHHSHKSESPVYPNHGMATLKSPHSVTKTLDRLEVVLKKKGITIFARVNHSAGAENVGIPLRPTELLIFGNPKLASPLMVSNQTIGLDLPLKALAWKDEKGQVWLTYNAPGHVARRHKVKDQKNIVEKMATALDKLTKAATKP